MGKTQGTEKELFQTKDFLRLLGKSKAAAGMDPAEYYSLSSLAYETRSVEAKAVYDLLIEEEKRMGHVEHTYEKLVKEAVDDFENGMTDLNLKDKRRKLEEERNEKMAEDAVSAEELLKQIK